MRPEDLDKSLKLTEEENFLIAAICGRGHAIARAHGKLYDPVGCAMDVAFCHLFHCPLKLREWLNASDYDFSVEFVKLIDNWDRATFTLRDNVKLAFSSGGIFVLNA